MATRTVRKQPSQPLDPGDHIEVGVTGEITAGGQKFWVKVAVTGTVRDGEDSDAAADRVGDFVMDKVSEQIDAWRR